MATEQKSTVVPQVITLVLMATTTAALYFGVDVRLTGRPGVRMEMPSQVGGWMGHELRYCQEADCLAEFDAETLRDRTTCLRCGKPLFSMTKGERAGLPADTTIIKGRYTRADGATLVASIVLSGSDTASIHRPQFCLVAQGLRIMGTRAIPVKTDGGNSVDVMTLDLVPAHRVGMTVAERHWKGQYAYWFVGQGRITPSYVQMMLWLYWDRLVHGIAHRWAYISVMGSQRTTPDELQRQMKDFISAFYPQIAVP